MSLDTSNKLSVRITNKNSKYGSGIIYIGKTHSYVLTAKHCACAMEITTCQEKGRECNKCELKGTYRARQTQILIDKPDSEDFIGFKPKMVISMSSKDIAILVMKDADHKRLKHLPKIEINQHEETIENIHLYSTSYPSATGSSEATPIFFNYCAIFKNELYLKLDIDTTTNIEDSKTNLSSASGAGILLSEDNKVNLVGIYVKTSEFSGAYAEYIDNTVNLELSKNMLPELKFRNHQLKIKNLITKDFLECFSPIEHDIKMDKGRALKLFCIKIDGKAFNYENLTERLCECIHLFCIPRKIIKKFEKEKKMKKLYAKGDSDFIAIDNEDKVAELLQQGLLESDMSAPKLYSSDQSKDSKLQGVHLQLADDSSYKLIHCVSKMGGGISEAFTDSINILLQEVPKIKDANSMISSSTFESTFTLEEQTFLESILIPTKEEKFKPIGNSFAVFIGFDFEINNALTFLDTHKFKEHLHAEIKNEINKSFDNLNGSLDSAKIIESEIYCYLIPFESTKDFKINLLKEL